MNERLDKEESQHKGWATRRRWVLYLIGGIIGVPVLIFSVFSLTSLISQRPITRYIIHNGIYEVKVVYHPGGGAIGGNDVLEAKVSGGEWNNRRLLSTEGADSIGVVFTEQTVVHATAFQRFYTDVSHYYWIKMDSAVLDLGNDSI